MQDNICPKVLIIEPESNQWLPLSLTHSLTDSLINSCFVDLIHVPLTCEDTNSNLVEVVTVADVDAEKLADDSLVHICRLKFDQKVKFLFRF